MPTGTLAGGTAVQLQRPETEVRWLGVFTYLDTREGEEGW